MICHFRQFRLVVKSLHKLNWIAALDIEKGRCEIRRFTIFINSTTQKIFKNKMWFCIGELLVRAAHGVCTCVFFLQSQINFICYLLKSGRCCKSKRQNNEIFPFFCLLVWTTKGKPNMIGYLIRHWVDSVKCERTLQITQYIHSFDDDGFSLFIRSMCFASSTLLYNLSHYLESRNK